MPEVTCLRGRVTTRRPRRQTPVGGRFGITAQARWGKKEGAEYHTLITGLKKLVSRSEQLARSKKGEIHGGKIGETNLDSRAGNWVSYSCSMGLENIVFPTLFVLRCSFGSNCYMADMNGEIVVM